MLSNLPIMSICGFSGAGKTTLIEQLVPRLLKRGLKVAVVKHDAHGIMVDRYGKDSDRLFRTGADVFLNGPQEEFFRVHSSDNSELTNSLLSISSRYDIVLVEGWKDTPLTKVWLLSDRESSPPSNISKVLASLPRNSDRIGRFMSIFNDWLPLQWIKPPVYGCVLIGGKSARMGKPKHLIIDSGKTWLKKTICQLKQITNKVVIAGAGDIPKELEDVVCLPDVHGIPGPMAGILSSMRWSPYTSWLIVPCDLPRLSLESLQWLLSTRRPGVWATIPKLPGSRVIEPLLAHYDFRSHSLFEKLVSQGVFSPWQLAEDSKVIKLSPPDTLADAWRNINTNTELELHKGTVKKFATIK